MEQVPRQLMQNIHEATLAISDYPEKLRESYRRYLEERVFEVLKDSRPWGINGETMKMLLMECLVQEELGKGLAAPDLQDVLKIFSTYWNIIEVEKQQQVEEFKALDISTDEKKPNRVIQTAPNGIIGMRTFVDIGADTDVLREVAKIRRGRKLNQNPKSKLAQAYESSMNSLDVLKSASVQAVISVANERSERRKQTEQIFAVREPVPPNRWDWLSDKQESLRHNEAAETLLKNLIPEEGTSVAAVSNARKRAATGASHSSTSSAKSRQTGKSKPDAEAETQAKKRGRMKEGSKKSVQAVADAEKETRKRRKT